MILKKSLLLVCVCALAVGCGSKRKVRKPIVKRNQQVHRRFELGIKYLDETKYKKAIGVFDNLLVQKPTSDLDIVILFNSAIAHEGLKRCKTAVRRFRQVVDAAKDGRLPRIEAQALVRLSYVYECLGKDTHVITSLLDARQRVKHLRPTVAKAELPARLAAAYLRVGNRKKSEYYFDQAELGIKSLRLSKEDPVQAREVLASTLFVMGRLDYSGRVEMPLDTFVYNAREMQKYLLKSVEMERKNWSPKSARQIVKAYKYIWKEVRHQPIGKDKDRELAKKEVVTLQKKVLRGAVNNIEELRNMRFPDTMKSKDVVWLFKRLDMYKKKYLSLLANLSEENTLTPNARARQNLFKPYLQKGKATILEKKGKRK